ncbi:tRNA pseudouridine(38-40) synthase TruA [Sunxiuqinia sp. A32]|uniref:tRNA pseudouridine(38-40) synthase TruA n=1 Tax=Sunxiuqinia sp. A32 TaxID=3461496 RepID=UPI0040463105
MRQRYFIELAYKGTNFHGWQIQPNAKTVQEFIENGLSTICRETIAVTGAGRTDTGVHASYFVAHFDSEKSNLDHPNFTYKLNSFLNSDIVIFSVHKVQEDAHARFDASSRTYHYFINVQKDPFTQETSWYLRYPLNVDKMNEACAVLFDYIDFTSFSKLHTDVKTNNCKIYYAKWKQDDNRVIFKIKADRFLRNMVRAIVGTMVDIGQGKISVQDLRDIIEAKDRSVAGVSVPAQGLFLSHIAYPEEIFAGTSIFE